MGLDVNALVDQLVQPGCDVFRELNGARETNRAVFQSGKAVTAIISNLARRRNLRIAIAVWDWMDSIGIDKNTFHYNSMISVCEKVRDYNKALRLLDEMKDKHVAKNEVTYVRLFTLLEIVGSIFSHGSIGQHALRVLATHLCRFDSLAAPYLSNMPYSFSSAISACEKCGQWRTALDLLDQMVRIRYS
jgi:pentatricopeptide repeat protein